MPFVTENLRKKEFVPQSPNKKDVSRNIPNLYHNASACKKEGFIFTEKY